MAALKAERNAQSEQHRENMKVLEGQNKTLENQHTALMELIRRTSGTPAQEDG